MLDSIINIHGSSRRDLTVCGRTFKGISKSGEGYSTVPNCSYILFVHGRPDHKQLVVVDTNNCSILEVTLEGIRFNGDFRSHPAPTQKIGDYVESCTSNTIVLVSKTLAYFERSRLDVSTGAIRVTDLTVYDRPLDFGVWGSQNTN